MRQFLLLILSLAAALAANPNPPTWPDSVVVFKPTDTDIDAKVQAAFQENGGHDPPNHGQFSSARFAFLFSPGTYTTDVPVGYYTQVLGLGSQPTDVVFNGTQGVFCEEGDFVYSGGALDTFWRSAENFQTTSSFKWATGTGMMWATSQGVTLRRVKIDNELVLYEYEPPYQDAGYASGGFLANSVVGGTVQAGGQQQWMTRNCELSGWAGGVWNNVYAGTKGAPDSHCGNAGGSPYTTAAQTPTMAEKPFLTVDGSGKFAITVPALRQNSAGVDWTSAARTIDFTNVFVATPATSVADINAQLAAGAHVVLTPGLYSLTAPIAIVKPGQILMGLGYPTLISATGSPVITVADVDDVRLVGPFLLQAGTKPTSTLLQWGTGAGYAGSSSKPGIMYDLFARVGGPDTFPVQARTMVQIFNGNVIGDNLWLWRADHTVSGAVMNSDNPCLNGLQVFGDDVTFYGLATEHVLQDLVQWGGKNGQVYFYQSELPYDVTQPQFGAPGFTGFRVNSTATGFKGYGLGVYHNFIAGPVEVASAIVAPQDAVFVNPLTVFLSGNGTIDHIVNNQGASTHGPGGGGAAWLCN